MSEPVWSKFLTEQDRLVFDASGYGARQGYGKRPAVLVVDTTYDFCGDRREPILESIKRWRNSCGENAWTALQSIKCLLDASRARGLPVIYTTIVRRTDSWDTGSWAWKNTRSLERKMAQDTGLPGTTIMPVIAPQARDIIIYKQKPSAFHGTSLIPYLTLLGADSLIVVGTTTSGCVRASVIDAFSNNYRVTVVEEGCFDRFESSHALSLCDMHAKYADVVKLDEVIGFIETLPEGLFQLPTGA